MLKTRCWKHGHPGEGQPPPPGWAKPSPFSSTEGDRWAESRCHAAPGPPESGKQANQEASRLSPTAAITTLLGPLHSLHRHHGTYTVLSPSVTPLSKMISTLTPTPLTLHMDRLLWHHYPCGSRVMLCFLCTSQVEPQPRCSLHRVKLHLCGTLCWLGKSSGVPLTAVTAAEPPPRTQPHAHQSSVARPTPTTHQPPCCWKAGSITSQRSYHPMRLL